MKHAADQLSKNTPIKALVSKNIPFTTTINDVAISREVFREQMVQWTLVEIDGEFVFESCCDDEILSPTKHTEQFNEVCKEILEANAELKGEVYPPQPENTHKVRIIDGDFDNITINYNQISSEVFEQEKTEWIAMEREEAIEWLLHLSRETKTDNAEAILKTVETMKSWEDKIVITNRQGSVFLSATATPDEWNKACDEIVEADDELY